MEPALRTCSFYQPFLHSRLVRHRFSNSLVDFVVLFAIKVQAFVVALLASALAIIFARIGEEPLPLWNGAVLVSAALSTASTASALLGAMVCAVVYAAHHYGINPDNIAAPLAASIGDVTTLVLLACYAETLHACGNLVWLTPLVGSLTMIAVCVAWARARLSPITAGILRTGWTPVLCAMCISRLVSKFYGCFALKGSCFLLMAFRH